MKRQTQSNSPEKVWCYHKAAAASTDEERWKGWKSPQRLLTAACSCRYEMNRGWTGFQHCYSKHLWSCSGLTLTPRGFGWGSLGWQQPSCPQDGTCPHTHLPRHLGTQDKGKSCNPTSTSPSIAVHGDGMGCTNKVSRREENPTAFRNSAQQLQHKPTSRSGQHILSLMLKASFKIKLPALLLCL